ncbi:MAG: hypothetical protein HYR51_02895 [Candidatus Rokubacteria bacterium]|nr:hypothetical protein [Candidatus Rokubacteria bacterium]
MNGFTLVADDGRRIMVETARAGSAAPDVQPGDHVTVVGRARALRITLPAARVTDYNARGARAEERVFVVAQP